MKNRRFIGEPRNQYKEFLPDKNGVRVYAGDYIEHYNGIWLVLGINQDAGGSRYLGAIRIQVVKNLRSNEWNIGSIFFNTTPTPVMLKVPKPQEL